MPIYFSISHFSPNQHSIGFFIINSTRNRTKKEGGKEKYHSILRPKTETSPLT